MICSPYDANAQYDQMQNIDGWNMTPTLVENQSGQYVVPIRSQEMSKFNKSQSQAQANDPKMQYPPYQNMQNMWPNEPAQMEYSPKSIESNIKHEQQQQSSANTTTSAANKYV